MTPDVSSVAPLADGFPAPDRAAWLALVDKVLKGAPFDRLTARTGDGIALGPLDTAEDAPAPAPPLWGPRDVARPWEVRTVVAAADPAEAGRQALDDLRNGAASVLLRLDPAGADGIAAGSADDLRRALEGVHTDLAPVALDAGWLGPQAAGWLSEAAGRGPAAPLAFHMDPLGAFARDGASPGALAAHMAAAGEAAARLLDTHPQATAWLADGRAVHEAGGTEAQELAAMAAAALAYLRAGEAAGMTREAALRAVVLGVSVDGRFLLSVAKLRAARLLWGRMAAACGVDAPARIEARSSARMLSRLDAWTNLVRLTAAGFAGAVGGADAVVLAPFTEPLGPPTDFARRQARNTQLVLQEEAHLGRVADPAAGAWSLERVADDLARRAWAGMQAIEREGGLAAALRAGRLQEEVAAARAALERDVAVRRAGLVGVSEFPSLVEASVEVGPAPAPVAPRVDVRRPGADDRAAAALAPMRLSAPFERLRARASAAGRRPRVFLAELGPVSEHAARAGFARNLLAAGGMVAEGGPPDAFDLAETPLAVLVGSDELYASEGTAALRALRERGARAVWVAGPELAGADGRLQAGCDAPAVLDRLLTELGA